jgi:GT2 family glycosyltransferase
VERVRVRGKFLYAGERKLYVRGVTYGAFRPANDGLPSRDVAARDFTQMAANGINAVRTYSVPPRWLLDLALQHGLYVMVGIPWEQHVAFLDDPAQSSSVVECVRAGVAACARHPAVLCYVIGNEIPAPIVRWHGRRRVERFIERLYRAAKAEDPDALVTYVNYPTTEYLQLPFLELACFNVYLEAEDLFEAYLARLQNVAGERPLIMAEIGLDSRRHGEEAQAISLGWQIHAAYAAGCAGIFVFAWTDEWHRGGHDVEEWDFGLVDRAREPKLALGAARTVFAEVPFRADLDWPSISIVVCTYNGAATLRDCLEGVADLDYPDFECIVIDDGSTDGTSAIALEFDVRLISTANDGLASARNRGLRAATGEIVAYVDDDTRPDPHWLRYLAATFMTTRYAAVGGPSIPPGDDGVVADCVARAPGGPTHVLVSDREAEHIPGCNMAFRRDVLQAIGGFDPQFRVAGDDVDICWRLHEAGWTIGFSPGAVIFHRRRNSVRGYLFQQVGYGRAEALLERKWPEKYNGGGHVSWKGRVYGNGEQAGWWRPRIYYGLWGSSPFQSLYGRSSQAAAMLPLMPEWYLLVAALATLATYEVAFSPLLLSVPGVGLPASVLLLALASLLVLVQAMRKGWSAVAYGRQPSRDVTVRRLLTGCLWTAQPLARLWGRVHCDLTPWRRREGFIVGIPLPRSGTVWSERWMSLSDRLRRLEGELRLDSASLRRGSSYDRWDLQVRSGGLGWARLRITVEEHGYGRQLLRYRVWARWSRVGTSLALSIAALLALAASRGQLPALIILGPIAAGIAARTLHDFIWASRLVVSAVERQGDDAPDDLLSALTPLGAAARDRLADDPFQPAPEPSAEAEP